MPLGAGIIEGTEVDQLIGFRPGDRAYIEHNGAVFHPQNEGGGGNAAYYEIQNVGDNIDFTVKSYMANLEDPALVMYTQWGETDFDIIDLDNNSVLVTEQSGFGADVWAIDILPTSGEFRLTNFNTADGVDGTQAGWLPFVGLRDRVL